MLDPRQSCEELSCVLIYQGSHTSLNLVSLGRAKDLPHRSCFIEKKKLERNKALERSEVAINMVT